MPRRIQIPKEKKNHQAKGLEEKFRDLSSSREHNASKKRT